jgi:hypothetical protein
VAGLQSERRLGDVNGGVVLDVGSTECRHDEVFVGNGGLRAREKRLDVRRKV